MDCKDCEKLVPEFIQNKLDYATTRCFLEHLRSCSTCKEELNIQFLVEEGLVRLEEGSAFDLQKEMRELLGNARKKVRFHERWLTFGRVLEAVIMLGIGAAVAAIIIL